jgi:hypothetical protein
MGTGGCPVPSQTGYGFRPSGEEVRRRRPGRDIGRNRNSRRLRRARTVSTAAVPRERRSRSVRNGSAFDVPADGALPRPLYGPKASFRVPTQIVASLPYVPAAT